MTRLSRAVRRITVMGAVLALGAVLIAPPAGSSENGSKSLDPPGVDVPGWEAEKVSGEAAGCWAEIELTLDPAQIPDLGDAGAANMTAAVSDAVGSSDIGYLGQLISAMEEKLQVGISAADDDDPPGIELFHQEVGPLPEVEIPWQGGGPVDDDEEECTLDLFGIIPLQLATDLQVESEGLIGPAGYAHTETESHDNEGLTYFADQIDTECLATLEDIDAKTTIEDGTYFDLDDFTEKDIPEHPDENEELTDFQFTDPDIGLGVGINIEYSLVANEQEETDRAVDVTGISSELLIALTNSLTGEPFLSLTVEGFRGESHCDIHPVEVAVVEPIEVEPKFTG